MLQDITGQGSKIIIFTGSRGGSGTTFLASSAACYLADYTERNILFLDLNSYSLDIRIIFNIRDKALRDLGDIDDPADEIDAGILKRLTVNTESSLNLILSPLIGKKADIFYKGKLPCLFNRLKEFFEIIVVDIPRHEFMQGFYEIDEIIDRLVIVTLPEMISINNTDLMVNEISKKRNLLKTDILINKYNIRPHIPPAKISSILSIPIKAFIPYDRDIEYLYLREGPHKTFDYDLRTVRQLKDYIHSLT